VDVLMAWSRALGGVSSPSRERSAVCHSGLGRDDSGVVICEDGGADPRWQRASEDGGSGRGEDGGGDGGRRSGLVGDTPKAHRRRPWALPAVPLYHREGVLMGEGVQIAGAPRKVPW